VQGRALVSNVRLTGKCVGCHGSVLEDV
jgi:hypothetical protein